MRFWNIDFFPVGFPIERKGLYRSAERNMEQHGRELQRSGKQSGLRFWNIGFFPVGFPIERKVPQGIAE